MQSARRFGTDRITAIAVPSGGADIVAGWDSNAGGCSQHLRAILLLWFPLFQGQLAAKSRLFFLLPARLTHEQPAQSRALFARPSQPQSQTQSAASRSTHAWK